MSESKGLLSFNGVLCLTLAFMIFAWGTSYKLSLYNPGHENSPAKVCTRGSDTIKSALDRAVGSPAPVQFHLLVSALLLLPQETEGRFNHRLSGEAVSDLSPLSQAPILYLRPPPDERRAID
jgi:hypothetical protein